MRNLVLTIPLITISLLSGCADSETGLGPPVSEDQIRCFEFEQTFTNPDASVTERSRARSNFFSNDCVLRGGRFVPPRA